MRSLRRVESYREQPGGAGASARCRMAFLFMKGHIMPVTTPASRSPFDLDIRVVSGPDQAAALLLGSTDDGCDTKRQGDC